MAKKHGQGSPVAENSDAIGAVAGHAIAARTESSAAAARCAAIPMAFLCLVAHCSISGALANYALESIVKRSRTLVFLAYAQRQK